MTNADVQRLKAFIKFTKVIDMIPGGIDNWAEKLSGKPVRGKVREFTSEELSFIETVLFVIARNIQSTVKK